MEHYDKLLNLVDDLKSLTASIDMAKDVGEMDQIKLSGVKLYQEVARQLYRANHEFRNVVKDRRASLAAKSFANARALAHGTTEKPAEETKPAEQPKVKKVAKTTKATKKAKK